MANGSINGFLGKSLNVLSNVYKVSNMFLLVSIIHYAAALKLGEEGVPPP